MIYKREDADWDAKEHRMHFIEAVMSIITNKPKEPFNEIFEEAERIVETAYDIYPDIKKKEGIILAEDILNQSHVLFEKLSFQEIIAKVSKEKSVRYGSRTIGRYYSSEVSKICKKWMTPKDFFIKKEIDEVGRKNILRGCASEDALLKLFREAGLKFQHEPQKYIFINLKTSEIEIIDGKDYALKKEPPKGKIMIVVKPDFVFPDKTIETKDITRKTFSNYLIQKQGKIPHWYNEQLETQYRAFGKDVYLGEIADLPGNRFDLLTFAYTPSKIRWKNIIQKLIEFHNEVIKLKRSKSAK